MGLENLMSSADSDDQWRQQQSIEIEEHNNVSDKREEYWHKNSEEWLKEMRQIKIQLNG